MLSHWSEVCQVLPHARGLTWFAYKCGLFCFPGFYLFGWISWELQVCFVLQIYFMKWGKVSLFLTLRRNHTPSLTSGRLVAARARWTWVPSCGISSHEICSSINWNRSFFVTYLYVLTTANFIHAVLLPKTSYVTKAVDELVCRNFWSSPSSSSSFLCGMDIL